MTVNDANLHLRKLGIIEALFINIDDEHNAGRDSQLPDRKSQYRQATINININIYVSQITLT